MKNLSKHFQTIGKAKHLTSRPILQGIHYNHNIDALEMTDSHRLLQVKIGYQLPVSYTYHNITLEHLEGDYPNTERLIPNKHYTYFTKDNLPTALLTKLAPYKKELIQLIYSTNLLTIAQENGNIIDTIPLHETQVEENPVAYVNGQYFYDMIAFVTDYYATPGNQNMQIYFTYLSSVRPITFSNNDFTYLCTPVRKS